ncbi:hypothetical protein [Streptomyces collinus]|uniref:hypothetical protein n=1 Tax=Streptomyces collinus TaxID=42684 RepID=UPI0033174198
MSIPNRTGCESLRCMSIAKKGTRMIVVDGDSYRWVVAPNDEPGLAIVVVHGEADGQRMVTWAEHGVVIAPGLVAAVIRQALLHHCWTPRERGKQLTLRCLDVDPDAVNLSVVAWPPG